MRNTQHPQQNTPRNAQAHTHAHTRNAQLSAAKPALRSSAPAGDDAESSQAGALAPCQCYSDFDD
eukprot:10946378-Alexandrium_andersonii.AAC.1